MERLAYYPGNRLQKGASMNDQATSTGNKQTDWALERTRLAKDGRLRLSSARRCHSSASGSLLRSCFRISTLPG